MRLIDADALKKAIPNTHVDIFENCCNCRLLDDEQVKQLIDDAPTIELLKEQEAKEVESEVINEIDRLYRCPSCHISMLLRGQPYCHYCGQAVKWE